MDNDLRQSADQLDWQRHEQTLWRFERAWIEDGQPAIADFLADKTAATRQYLLRELIKLDLEYHWKAGNRVRVEDYLHRFPELGDLSAADDLLEEEFLARRHVSQLPDQDEIADRFPDKRAKIERLVDAVASGVEKPYETIVSQADRTPGTHLGGLSGGDSHLRSLGLARGVTIERYVLCEEVGRGGFASVWRRKTLNFHAMSPSNCSAPTALATRRRSRACCVKREPPLDCNIRSSCKSSKWANSATVPTSSTSLSPDRHWTNGLAK